MHILQHPRLLSCHSKWYKLGMMKHLDGILKRSLTAKNDKKWIMPNLNKFTEGITYGGVKNPDWNIASDGKPRSRTGNKGTDYNMLKLPPKPDGTYEFDLNHKRRYIISRLLRVVGCIYFFFLFRFYYRRLSLKKFRKVKADDCEDDLEEKSEDSKGLGQESTITGEGHCACTDKVITPVTSSVCEKITQCRAMMDEIKMKTNCPGLVVATSVDGNMIWKEGLGYADVENGVKCTQDTMFRIASISKSITMAAVAKLWEEGKLDLDKPVQHYVPEFPEKTWKGEKVAITTRQLVSHLSGIRHYSRDVTTPSVNVKSVDSKSDNPSSKSDNESSLRHKEIYNKKLFSSSIEGLEMFKDDPLVAKPGSRIAYTSNGWNLVTAIVERASGMSYEEYLKTILADLGLADVCLEKPHKIIYNRARQYLPDKDGAYRNSPYIDVSYKWGSEGLLSNIRDLIKFGNAMLYSYQAGSINDNDTTYTKPGFLKPDTMKMLWSRVQPNHPMRRNERGMGMGWMIRSEKRPNGQSDEKVDIFYHTGGAVGGASVLVIVPTQTSKEQDGQNCETQSTSFTNKLNNQHMGTKGVVVGIICNMDSDFTFNILYRMAVKMAFIFMDS